MTNSEKLKLAVAKGDVATVTELLNHKAACDTFKDGRTLLHVASQNGRLEVIEILLENGSNISSKDANGYTPLQLASAQGHVEVIKFLLESGAPVDDQDQYGNTALHMAAWNGFSSSLGMLMRFHANINASNKVGFSALHTAAQKGHNQSARVLIYAGAILDAKNKYGETPLHTSTRHAHAGVAQILINAKAKLDSKNKEGDTCLHLAAGLKRNKIAKLLIEAGAKKSIKNKSGDTALDVARKNNSSEITEMLQNTASSEEKKKKGLFNFLKRKNNSSCSSRDHSGLVEPSLPSSVGSNKNVDQNLSRAGSSGEIREAESSLRALNSIDRLQSRRQSKEIGRPPRSTTSLNPQRRREASSRHGDPELSVDRGTRDAAYDTYDPKSSRDAGRCDRTSHANHWHPANPIVASPGCCPNLFYTPGYGGLYGGVPHYPVGFYCRPTLVPGPLTQSIENNMYHYMNLDGNLNQGSTFINPACPAPLGNHPSLAGIEDYSYEFDVDADSYVYRGHQIPQYHFYEPIGSRGLYEPHSEDEGELGGARRAAQRRGRQPHATSNAISHPNISETTFPLEPKIVVANSDAFRSSRPVAGNENNASVPPVNPYNLQPLKRRDSTMPKTNTKSRMEQERDPFPRFQPIRKCLSDETISTVMGSSNARRKAYTRRSLHSKNRQREERSKNARANSEQKRRSARHTNERRCGDKDEDYLSSESSIRGDVDRVSCKIDSDESFSSSSGNGEEIQKSMGEAGKAFQMEVLQASPKKKSQAGEPCALDAADYGTKKSFCPSSKNHKGTREATLSTKEATLKNEISNKTTGTTSDDAPPFHMSDLSQMVQEILPERHLNAESQGRQEAQTEANRVTAV